MNNNYTITSSFGIHESQKYYIVFTVKKNKYAINIQNIMEVINIPDIEIPSVAPDGIIGIFNYKGLMINVIDLCPFLGFHSSGFSINNQLIIAHFEGNCFAIHTEKIDNIMQFDIGQTQDLPFNIENSIIKEIYKYEENAINIIDIKMLNTLISRQDAPKSDINYIELFPSDEKSKQILKLRTLQNNKNREIFSFPFNLNTLNQYILFTLDNHNYYLDLKYVKEFISIKRLNITKLPYTQDFIKGIINLKGDFLVVIDLKRFLNNDINKIKEGSKIIVVQGKNFNLAFLVDEIKFIKNIENSYNSVNTNSSKYILSEFMEEGKLYSILNFDKIINDERLYVNI